MNEFQSNNNELFIEINKWFHSNLLMLNYEKTHFLQFLTKTDYEINMQVSFNNRKIVNDQSLKFLGLTLDTTLTWKHHISELTTRLNKACYAIRAIKPFMTLDVLRNTYIFFFIFTQLYLMESYFGATLLIVKKYLKYRKE